MTDELQPISLDRLFRVEQPVKIAGRDLIVRALSSYEIKCRFDEATLATLETRRSLRDKSSRYYQLYIAATLENATDDELRLLVIRGTSGQAAGEAVRDIQAEFVPVPDDASDNERMDVMEARKASVEKAVRLRNEFVQKKTDARAAEVKTWERPQLETEYERLAVATCLDNTFGEVFNNSGLLYAVRLPDGRPYFNSLEDVVNCDDRVRARLSMEVRSINDINPLLWSGPSLTASLPAAGS